LACSQGRELSDDQLGFRADVRWDGVTIIPKALAWVLCCGAAQFILKALSKERLGELLNNCMETSRVLTFGAFSLLVLERVANSFVSTKWHICFFDSRLESKLSPIYNQSLDQRQAISIPFFSSH
jgi:hypothetical protein